MIPLLMFCLAWSHLQPLVTASCRNGGQFGGPLCCQNKDINCVTDGYRVNSAYYHDTCFCDRACVDSKDCCSDYESACPGEIYNKFIHYFDCYNYYTRGPGGRLKG